MGNHLGPFTEALDRPEGQEQPLQAVGGQGELHGVTSFPSLLETWIFLNPRFLGMAYHLGPFPEASDGPGGQEQPVQTVGGQGEHQNTRSGGVRVVFWWCSYGVLVVF